MINILGNKYLTTKEAVYRYGYSESWFKRRRWNNLEPKYIKMEGMGRVLYELENTDKWFQKKLKEC